MNKTKGQLKAQNRCKTGFLSSRSLFYGKDRTNIDETVRDQTNTKYRILTIKVMGLPRKKKVSVDQTVWKSIIKENKNEVNIEVYLNMGMWREG